MDHDLYNHIYKDLLLEGSKEGDHPIWEIFHENSKLTPYSQSISPEKLKKQIGNLVEILPYEGYTSISLGTPESLPDLSLKHAIASRISSRTLYPNPLSLGTISTLLNYSCGINRQSQCSSMGRSFRSAPSAGALYPLEIYLYSVGSEHLTSGIYHFDPKLNVLQKIQSGDSKNRLMKLVLQPELISGASLVLFITAVFERLVVKYQDRGYRYALIESGHVAQNFNLVATSIGLGSVNIGGFFDNKVDEFLDIDGLTHSTIYMIAVGEKGEN